MLEEAKSGNKNSISLELRKGKGQNIHIKASNTHIGALKELLDLNMKYSQEIFAAPEKTLENFRNLIEIMDKESRAGRMNADAYLSAWMNLFDNDEQRQTQKYVKYLGEIYYRFFVAQRIPIESVRPEQNDNTLDTFLDLLQLRGFMRSRQKEDDI